MKPPALMNAFQFPKIAGRIRKTIFTVAIGIALILIPLIASDFLIQRKLTQFVSRLNGPLAFLAPLILFFLLADLIGEFRGFLSSPERPWTDRRHFAFVTVSTWVIALGFFLFYLIAAQAMIEDVGWGQD